MFILKRCSIIPFSFCFLLSCSQKRNDYATIFGDKYSDAVSYFQKNSWIADTLVKFGVDPNLAIPIVFPEAIRYSTLKDIIETHSLEVLYTQYGSKFADFSIGRFQIKPSFAYNLERDWNNYIKDNSSPIIMTFNTLDNPKARLERIQRLKDENWQVKYIVIFCKLIEVRFDKKWLNEDQKLEFYASAYNIGYWFDIKSIQMRGKKNYYHTGLLKPKRCFNYSDISLYYFHKIQMPK